jgi:hypothetical protein
MTKIFLVWVVLCGAWVLGAYSWFYGKPGQFNNIFSHATQTLKQTWKYEKASLALARENRLLKVKLSEVEGQLAQIQNEKQVLSAQLQEKKSKIDRQIASIAVPKSNDFVQYEVYQWTPEKLLAIGEKELHFKNYEKSAQFYHELVTRFADHASINDKTLFGAGISAFEAKKPQWAIDHLGTLMKKYPKSNFYRGAKLWVALAHYQMGDQEKFAETVEEFRKKYRNTDEWKILSQYYEDINYKFKMQ